MRKREEQRSAITQLLSFTKLAHDSYRMSEMCWETLDICYQTVIPIENLASFQLRAAN